MFFSCLFLALTLSLDGICVGITYGLKKTYIMPTAKLTIFGILFIITSCSVTIGKFIVKIFPISFANKLGVILLILMGIWMIYQSFMPKQKRIKEKNYNFFIRPLGITIKIIKSPINSDIDNSKCIDAKEALYLSFALALDNFCAGIGCSAIGINLLLFPLLTSLFHILFLSLGYYLGVNVANYTKIPDNVWSIISGLLLIGLGFFKLF